MDEAGQAQQAPIDSTQAPPAPPADKESPDDAPQSLKIVFANATDRVLTFVSNASNETLGACLVGFGATTYFVFGRVGLVLIGFVGGVVAHATWEHSNESGQDDASKAREKTRRREVGLDVVQRALDWQSRNRISVRDDNAGLGIEMEHSRANAYTDFKPETASTLSEFTDAVIRDYVKWWYSPILPSELSFPATCRKTLTDFILSLSSNVRKKRPADTFIEFTTNSSSILIVFFNELSAAVSASPNTPAPEAIMTYMELKPQCSLASIMDEKLQQRKLQMIADDLLESYLDPDVFRCPPAKVFLQQILTTTILETTIQKSSRAEWINEWIVYLLEEGEPEIMNAIDAGVGGVASTGNAGSRSGLASPQSPISPVTPVISHNRTVSRAEEAMDEAMREAKRLTQMIQEEEKSRNQEERSSTVDVSDTSDSTTQGVPTPSSSQGELALEITRSESVDRRPVSETNGVPHAAETNSNDEASSTFTSFDQLAPSRLPTALTESSSPVFTPRTDSLTLHKAKVQIFDDSEAVEKKTIKSKPTGDYLIQIEPTSNSFPGWMIPRTYADFEILHEVLRRISTITGIDFARVHPTPPAWKGNTKHQLRDEMERYLNDAMCFEQLAESEGMKRFLEKSRGLTQASPAKGFWPNPTNVGKGMLDVLTKAPNQVAGGGKAFLGGVSSVLGGAATNASSMNGSKRQSVPKMSPALGTPGSERSSMDLRRHDTSQTFESHNRNPASSRKTLKSLDLQADAGPTTLMRHDSTFGSDRLSSNISPGPHVSSSNGADNIQPTARDPMSDSPAITLPPPPENMPDDYALPLDKTQLADQTSHMSVDGTNFIDVPTPPTPRSPRAASPLHRGTPPSRTPSQLRNPRARAAANVTEEGYNRSARAKAAEERRTAPLTDSEAQVTIELLFAVITELYTLSSAWTLRRTLLGAAKTFLLRPGNPQLESIRLLLQETLLDVNTSDAGIASHIAKLRENCLPTEAELAQWPKERTAEEKDRLRDRARELVVKKGMPQALTSVMGAAASGEALGKVFDCLQVQEVARGVMFGLMLQAIRAISQ